MLAASDIRLNKASLLSPLPLSLRLYVLMLVFQRNAQLNSSAWLEAAEPALQSTEVHVALLNMN